MIYLNPEVRSGLGEDTFWTWFAREFPNSTFDAPPPVLPDGDCLLQYSTLGPPPCEGLTIGLMWELYHEMRVALGSDEWNPKIAAVEACADACTHRVVASPIMAPYYEPFGPVDVLPIGVDTDIFRPDGEVTRRRVFWCGTRHPMKGYERLEHLMAERPGWEFVVQWKNKPVPQHTLAEMMRSCNAVAITGKLRPFFMVEWEAMACGLQVLNLSGLDKDFEPSDDPRADVIRQGWARRDARLTWMAYLASLGVDV